MHGVKKILVFCLLITIMPITLILIPLYLRHNSFADVAYAVTESDILEVNDGVSTIFCSEHTLRMNSTFNAFQMTQKPEITSYRKHIRLKKSMNLPDDTLEYWGFYLLKNATVQLSVCSRFQGASLLVVKGERNLQTCGLLEHNKEKEATQNMFLPGANKQVKVVYESNAQEINSKDLNKSSNNNDIHKPAKNKSKSNTMLSETDLDMWYSKAETYIRKHRNDVLKPRTDSVKKLRHTNWHREDEGNRKERIQRRRQVENQTKGMRMRRLKRQLFSYEDAYVLRTATKMEDELRNERFKRSRKFIKPPSLLDQGIRHGGNADRNASESNEVSSVSSFERGLFNCYDGAILLAHEFKPSHECTDISYLINGKHMQTSHHVEENGYYYYIFYSDNDIVSNDIYALFDIYKPTFQYENVTKSCINKTKCSFSLNILSSDRVIVEIPTKNGIEHNEMDDFDILISTCNPRMGAYIIFPISVLFLIIGCAWL